MNDEFNFKPVPKPNYFKNNTFVAFLLITFIPIVIIYIFSLMYGTSDELSVRNILYVMSNTDMTIIFKNDIEHLKRLLDLFQDGSANFIDIIDAFWTLIQLVFDFGWNIINTLWSIVKVILVVIGAL